MSWDCFICHASEDKDDFVRPLAEYLRNRGLTVWFDEFSLRIGDSLRRSIDKGLAGSEYAIVVLSPHFFGKNWPEHELDGIVTRDVGKGIILPVWHNVSRAEVESYSLTLADKVAVRSSDGVESVAEKLIAIIRPDLVTASGPQIAPPSPAPMRAATIANLAVFLGNWMPNVKWSGHLRTISRLHRQYNLQTVDQVEEALTSTEACEQVNTIYQRLLERDADPLGLALFAPIAYYEGERGNQIIEQMVMRSPEYLGKRKKSRESRHKVGIESPPDNFSEPGTPPADLPVGWSGDTWVDPATKAVFMRAWQKSTGRYAVGQGPSADEASAALGTDIEEGTRRSGVSVRETGPGQMDIVIGPDEERP